VGRLRIDRLTGPPGPLTDGAGRVLALRCHTAERAIARLVGLLATPDLASDEALLITRCSSVHSLGLRAPIGVAFLDHQGAVLRVVDPLPRWRAVGARGAASAVEARAGVLAGLGPGDVLRVAGPA